MLVLEWVMRLHNKLFQVQRFNSLIGTGSGIPRSGLLMYLSRPNSDAYLTGETSEISEGDFDWGYYLGEDATVRSATGWTLNHGWETDGNPFYMDSGVSRIATATEIAAWSVINTGLIIFKLVSSERQEGKLVVYAIGTGSSITNKAKQVLRIS